MNRRARISGRHWTLIALAALGVFLFLIAPRAPQRVDLAGWQDLAARTVAGAYHVHTTRSDGHGDKAAVAAAAARAGIRFVILTDHGDGTRPPDPPEYMNGVLMLDAVEISTDSGHYVALDMPRAPFPLGGAAEAVVEDVHRFGGFGIAAHPDSAKAALRWTDEAARIDGIEWINADSEWRDERPTRLVRAGVAYFLRPAAALATLLDRPGTLGRWDEMLKRRHVVGLGAADAHGGPGRRVEDQNRTLFGTIGIPSYEASFGELSVRAILDQAPSGQAAEDARAIFGAIRRGRVFTLIDAIASPGLLDFHAVPSGATVTLEAKVAGPAAGTIVLLRDGEDVAHGAMAGQSGLRVLRREVPANIRAAYRLEVRLPGAPGAPPVPWLVSNPVYVEPAAAPGGPGSPRGTMGAAPLAAAIAPFPWRIEKDPASSAILRLTDRTAELQYQLAGGARASQFVALASDVNGQRFTAIELGLKSDRPVRVSAQVRAADGRRWGRSFYVDSAGTAVRAELTGMKPVGEGSDAIPTESLSSILLVIDLANALPGQSGRLTVLSSALVN